MRQTNIYKDIEVKAGDSEIKSQIFQLDKCILYIYIQIDDLVNVDQLIYVHNFLISKQVEKDRKMTAN